MNAEIIDNLRYASENLDDDFCRLEALDSLRQFASLLIGWGC